MELIRYKKSSIRQLGKLKSIDCTERTIRRSLNEGLITYKFLDQIARQLDLDPELLSGKLHKHADSIDDPILKQLYLNTLSPDRHPYYKKIYSEQIKKPIADFLSSLLSFFKISYKQLNEFPFEMPLVLQMLISCLLITGIELISGVIVNIFFHMNVWDYSLEKFNFLGQICLKASITWFFLSLPGIYIGNFIKSILAQ